jgi:1-acyl-sn-glycerol-3-phosphate acyltransferase
MRLKLLSSTLKHYFELFRTIFIIFWIVLITIPFSILTIIFSIIDDQGIVPHKVAGLWGRCILLGSRIKVNVKGLSNIDPTKPYIYMSNHQSNFDIPVILGFLDVQFRWLAKAELFKIPVFGYAMARAGYISIDRSNRKSAFRSLKKAAAIIRSGVSVLIFPEGTRSRDGKLQPFKKGGFVLSLQAGVPIVPVLITGTYAIMSKKGLHIIPGTVELEIGKPIDVSAYTMKTKGDLMRKVKEAISGPDETQKQGHTPC